MPGTPDPVLGSHALTVVVAVTAGVLVVAIPLLREVPAEPLSLTAGGLAYAAACLAVWAGVRFVTGTFTSGIVENPLAAVPWILLAVVVLSAQVVLPFYLYARWGLVAPLSGTVLATALVLYMFLQVRGETDPIGLYPLFFGPVLVVVTGVLAILEGGIRRIASPA